MGIGPGDGHLQRLFTVFSDINSSIRTGAFAVNRLVFVIGAALFIAACDRGPSTRTILDAAGLYSENAAVFETIRAAYPGPFTDFARVPARNPADETDHDKDLLKHLRGQIPIEFIDFYPIGDSDGGWGGDEIDVVLNRFGTGDKWVTISLVYFSVPLTLSDDDPNVRFFKTCEQGVADWVGDKSASQSRTAFCQINPNWYAHQRVE